jgi:glycosyltransferase involved in cell wall biosynthesis
VFAEYASLVIVFENLFGQGYQGGATWLETTLLALGTVEQPPLCLIWGATQEVLPANLKHAPHVEPVIALNSDVSRMKRWREAISRRVTGRPWEDRAITALASARKVDLWVGFSGFRGLGSFRPLIVWFPDFQFRYFPEFFDSNELRDREQQWDFVATRADAIIAISQSVASDAVATHPQVTDRVFVCGFPPIFTSDNLSQKPDDIRRRYHLPERFFLVCNQFFQHKNHRLVLRALNRLKENGSAPVVAFTGLPHDYRNPQAFADLLRYVNENGLSEHCRFLGVIPRDEQIALIREATAVIQPSKFEGRGAIVEETTIVGTPLLCSDLPVHRELHAPGALFFQPDGVDELAALMKRDFSSSAKSAEAIVDESQRLARTYGQQILAVCKHVLERRQAGNEWTGPERIKS